MNNLPDINSHKWAYLAGMVDGDGFITIQRTTKYTKRATGIRAKCVYHHLRVGISGVDRRIHDFAKDITGWGNTGKHKPENERHKTQYNWQITGPKALAFIKGIQPYVILKKEQCEVAIRYSEDVSCESTPPFKISDDLIERRDGYWRKIVGLNSSRKIMRSEENKLAFQKQ